MSKGKRVRAQRSAPPPVGKKTAPDRRLWIGAVALGALLVVGIAVAAIRSGGSSGTPVHVDFAGMTGLQDGPPPWNNGSGALQDRLASIDLTPLAQEALAFHIHQHLDVYVDQQHVTLPAQIGIYGNSFITEIHTHQTDGVVHVESAQNHPYTLGQLFGEWSVRLNARCLGRYCGHLHWWVNGKPQVGNPAGLALHAHQEIVVASGKPPTHILSSFSFAAGE